MNIPFGLTGILAVAAVIYVIRAVRIVRQYEKGLGGNFRAIQPKGRCRSCRFFFRRLGAFVWWTCVNRSWTSRRRK